MNIWEISVLHFLEVEIKEQLCYCTYTQLYETINELIATRENIDKGIYNDTCVNLKLYEFLAKELLDTEIKPKVNYPIYKELINIIDELIEDIKNSINRYESSEGLRVYAKISGDCV